ncbi:hypothetical protein [Solibacillus sp. CAU 1738]|uniref:hypothetical protein n=1 Tax=Solibacillus sp. CAU 1738 TaxID=3140363 RepID=UPI0032607096
MSKKFKVILAIVIVALIASRWYWEAQQLEQPIIVESRVDLDKRRIDVSYIVNSQDQTTLQMVEIGNESFYPNNSFATFMWDDTSAYSNVQEYTYYAIRHEEILLDERQHAYLLENKHLLDKGIVIFNHYSPITITPTILNETLLRTDYFKDSLKVDGHTNFRFLLNTTTELTIENIEVIHPTATYQVFYMDEVAKYPFIMEEGATLEIHFEQSYAFSTYGFLDVIVRGTRNGQKFEERFSPNFHGIAPEKAIRAYVKEALQ